jgi:predicted TIM-barrel fold metal-dependent hydrolase
MNLRKVLPYGFILLLFINCTDSVETGREYDGLAVIDVHNHDSYKYELSLEVWEKYKITKIVLFGAISEPRAVATDKMAWDAYCEYPDRFYPFFAGFDVHDQNCLEVVKDNFENGYFGIGEFVAASTHSPMTANLPWKGQHPMDGFFPQIYELCAHYHAPILLHIDPPFGMPIKRLEQALDEYKDTIFIFAHANAYNSPENIKRLLQKHNNLYIDFFAGFTAYNTDSDYTLDDYVPLIKEFADRFLVSSDSGYGVGYDKAYKAIYELFEKLELSEVEKIAAKNFQSLIEAQPVTMTQAKAIKKLASGRGIHAEVTQMNKRQANEWIFKHQM